MHLEVEEPLIGLVKINFMTQMLFPGASGKPLRKLEFQLQPLSKNST